MPPIRTPLTERSVNRYRGPELSEIEEGVLLEYTTQAKRTLKSSGFISVANSIL
jgi:hypothetical protein